MRPAPVVGHPGDGRPGHGAQAEGYVKTHHPSLRRPAGGLGGKCERDRDPAPRKLDRSPSGAQQTRSSGYHSRPSSSGTPIAPRGRTSRDASPAASRSSGSRSREGSQDSRGTPNGRGRMASFATGTKRSSFNSSRESSLEPCKERPRSRSNSVDRQPVERRTPNPKASGSAMADCFADVTLLKASWRSFELFKYLEEETMNLCINKMKVRTFNAGDNIIKRGSIGTTMFFIDLGTVRAEIRGHTAQTLKSGEYCGEIAFVATCKKFLRDKNDKSAPESAVRVADVVATSTCRLFELSVKDFITILQVCSGKRGRRVEAGQLNSWQSEIRF